MEKRVLKKTMPATIAGAGNIFRASGLKVETTVSCEYWVTGSHRSAQFAAGFVLRMLCILPTPAASVCRRSGRNQDSCDCLGSAAIGVPLLTLSPSFWRRPQKASDEISVRTDIVM